MTCQYEHGETWRHGSPGEAGRRYKVIFYFGLTFRDYKLIIYNSRVYFQSSLCPCVHVYFVYVVYNI